MVLVLVSQVKIIKKLPMMIVMRFLRWRNAGPCLSARSATDRPSYFLPQEVARGPSSFSVHMPLATAAIMEGDPLGITWPAASPTSRSQLHVMSLSPSPRGPNTRNLDRAWSFLTRDIS